MKWLAFFQRLYLFEVRRSERLDIAKLDIDYWLTFKRRDLGGNGAKRHYERA